MTAIHTLRGSDPVTRLLHRQPVHVLLDTTLRACARVMAEESIGAVLVREIRHLAVTRDGQTVGLISSRDVLAVMAIA